MIVVVVIIIKILKVTTKSKAQKLKSFIGKPDNNNVILLRKNEYSKNGLLFNKSKFSDDLIWSKFYKTS